MKKALLILCLACTVAAHGEVTLTDTGRVLQDGADIGAVPDAILNKLVTPTEVQAAVVAKLTALLTAKTAAEAAKEAVVTKAEAALAEPGDLSPLAEVVGAAKLTAKEKRLAEIAAEKAKLDAEKAELEAKAAQTLKR